MGWGKPKFLIRLSDSTKRSEQSELLTLEPWQLAVGNVHPGRTQWQSDMTCTPIVQRQEPWLQPELQCRGLACTVAGRLESCHRTWTHDPAKQPNQITEIYNSPIGECDLAVEGVLHARRSQFFCPDDVANDKPEKAKRWVYPAPR
jgi:hypothetical protein